MKNVKTKILNVVKSIYENVKSCVIILSNEFSETFVLVLFICFVNYMYTQELLGKNCKYLDFNFVG